MTKYTGEKPVSWKLSAPVKVEMTSSTRSQFTTLVVRVQTSTWPEVSFFGRASLLRWPVTEWLLQSRHANCRPVADFCRRAIDEDSAGKPATRKSRQRTSDTKLEFPWRSAPTSTQMVKLVSTAPAGIRNDRVERGDIRSQWRRMSAMSHAPIEIGTI